MRKFVISFIAGCFLFAGHATAAPSLLDWIDLKKTGYSISLNKTTITLANKNGLKASVAPSKKGMKVVISYPIQQLPKMKTEQFSILNKFELTAADKKLLNDALLQIEKLYKKTPPELRKQLKIDRIPLRGGYVTFTSGQITLYYEGLIIL